MAAVNQDKIQKRVTKAVDAAMSQKTWNVFLAVFGLTRLDAGEVIAELCLQIEDNFEGVDRDALIQAAVLPADWEDRHAILNAVEAADLPAIFKAFHIEEQGSPVKLYASMLELAGSLKEARAKF